MRKLNLLLIISSMLLVGCTTSLKLTGDGSEESPFLIANTDEFINFVKASHSNSFDGIYFKLTSDIDLNGAKISSIGNQYGFNGFFDGGNHTISNFSIVNSENENYGLFSQTYNTSEEVVIHDLKVKDFSIDIKSKNIGYVGGLVGNGHCKLANIETEGEISIYDSYFYSIGGIAGYNEFSIVDSSNKTNISLEIEEYHDFDDDNHSWINVAGIVGMGKGKIYNCTNYGEIITKQIKSTDKINDCNLYVAGIVGNANENCVVEKCVNNATLNGMGYTGGIVGSFYPSGTIMDCINYGDIYVKSEKQNDSGGIVATSYSGVAEIDRCFNYGNINVESIEKYTNTKNEFTYYPGFIGGIIGGGYGNIDCCAAECDITTSGVSTWYVGGLAGGQNSALTNSYFVGNITATSSKNTCMVGGIAGVVQPTGSIQNTYAVGSFKLLNGYGGGMSSYHMVGNIFGYNMNATNIIKNNYHTLDKLIIEDDGYYYPTYYYGEQDPGQAENVNNETVCNNVLVTYEQLTSGEKMDYLKTFVSLEDLKNNPNNVWVYKTGQLPRLYCV